MLILIGAIFAFLGVGATVASQSQVAFRERRLRYGTALLLAGITLVAASFPMI